MNQLITRQLDHAQQAQLMKLWNREYPAQLGYGQLSEFRSYLDGLADVRHYMLTGAEGQIFAWAFTFTRQNDRWFAIILDSRIQRQGHGSRLLNMLKEQERQLSGWVTDHDRYTKQGGALYLSPVGFYLKNGFTICEEVRLETEKLSAVKIYWSGRH